MMSINGPNPWPRDFSSLDWLDLSQQHRQQKPDFRELLELICASDQFRQLSLLWRRHKVKTGLHYTDEAQNQAETRVCSYPAPYCHDPVSSRFRCERSTQSYDGKSRGHRFDPLILIIWFYQIITRRAMFSRIHLPYLSFLVPVKNEFVTSTSPAVHLK